MPDKIEGMTDRARLLAIADLVLAFMAKRTATVIADDCDETAMLVGILHDIYRLATLPEIRQRGLFGPEHYDSSSTSIT